ncbi:aspartate aminotransferase family protein [Paraburkholderia sp.]|uniref:aspartate aminotransferase family protein n=1 Tax=Paraburkholderia sp. TaxID=1926495 RepID=UPI0039E54964
MDRDAQSVLGWRYEPGIIFERGHGVFITDVDGNDYYDMTSGMMCLVLGHAHPELVETIREQAGRLVHHSSWYSNPWAIEFAELLGQTLPGKLKVVNFAVTGSEANEIAMRMALGVTGKFDILSVIRGLHGGTLAAEAVTTVGGARRRGLGPLMIPAKANCIIPPFTYRAPAGCEDRWDEISLQLTEELIQHASSQQVAGVLAETMMVAGGMIVPSNEWMKGLRRIADKWGALLILDEAQLAPGRTGKMWGFEHYDIVPDIVTFAKGMSAGMPVCGTITTPEIAEQARGHAGIPWAGTYPQDPLPCAVALKQLQIVLRDDLVSRAAQLGHVLRARLDIMKDEYECIGDVRGKGLYQMLDIVADRRTKQPDYEMAERVRYYAAAEGVIVICVKNFIRLCPPTIISEAEIDDALGRLTRAINRAMSDRTTPLHFAHSSSLAQNDNAI